MRVYLGIVVEECRRDFTRVFARGTAAEKRQFTRLFVKNIGVDPDIAHISMYLFGSPTGLKRKGTPASVRTGVPIGLVAGAGFEPATFRL